MENEREMEIDLKQLFIAMLERAKMIISITLMFGIFAFFYSKFAIVPIYVTNATMYVNSNKNVISENIGISEMNTSNMLANVYVEMIKSNSIMKEVIEQTGLDYTLEQINSMISAAAVNETPIMRISVRSPYPKEAVVIANAVLDIAPAKITDFMDGGSVKVIDRPEEPKFPSTPNIPKNTILGLILGFVLSAGLVVLMELMDTRIKSTEQLQELYDLPVLGVIPEIIVNEE